MDETNMDETNIGGGAEDFSKSQNKQSYVLHLYITGATPNSIRAVKNIKAICEEHLQGRYELVVVDVYQQPALAQSEQIIAVPTLVKKQPQPLRRLVGDMSDTSRVLSGLGLE